MNVLITNIASVTAISLIKILRRGKIKDLHIWGTEAQAYGYNSGSILVDYYIQVSEVSSESYVMDITHICQNSGIDVLIPILDEELKLFSISELNNHVNILLPDLKVINLFRNKYRASIELLNICPKIIPQIYYNNLINSDMVIIRKKESIGSQGIIIKHKDELTNADFNNQDYFIQEYVKGIEYTVDVLCDKDGKIKLIVPRKRLQIKNGVSTKVEISNDIEIIDTCKQIYSKYCIPGLSNVQFIKQNNHIYFLELNMRFAAMGIASVIASYDYISDYILHLTFKKDLGIYSSNMEMIRWGTVICRYYEETVFMQ